MAAPVLDPEEERRALQLMFSDQVLGCRNHSLVVQAIWIGCLIREPLTGCAHSAHRAKAWGQRVAEHARSGNEMAWANALAEENCFDNGDEGSGGTPGYVWNSSDPGANPFFQHSNIDTPSIAYVGGVKSITVTFS